MLTMIPQGYKVAFHIKNEIGTMLEMIPERESLKLWTEMLTVHVMRNINGYTLDSFYAGMKEAWAAMCPCGSTAIVKRGHEKGLPTLFWSQICPLNTETGQPENTWFKLSIGSGILIVVQKAFKFEPSADEIAFWLDYLRELRIDHCR